MKASQIPVSQAAHDLFQVHSQPVPTGQGRCSDLLMGCLRRGQGSAQMKELDLFRRPLMSPNSALPAHSCPQGALSLAKAARLAHQCQCT